MTSGSHTWVGPAPLKGACAGSKDHLAQLPGGFPVAARLHSLPPASRGRTSMAHPKRAITRDIRTRRPKRATRVADEQVVLGWPEDTVRVSDVMTRPVTTFRTEMTVGAAVKAMRARKI